MVCGAAEGVVASGESGAEAMRGAERVGQTEKRPRCVRFGCRRGHLVLAEDVTPVGAARGHRLRSVSKGLKSCAQGAAGRAADAWM